MSEYSSFLFVSPSFARGAGSVLDLGATLTGYNRSLDEEAADHRALLADTHAVLADQRTALRELLAEL